MTAGEMVVLNGDSVTTANAGTNGDGGEVIVHSPGAAIFCEGAKIEAKGGSASGDGGFVEISGKEYIEIYGLVDTSAANGEVGTFLLDPFDLFIIPGFGGGINWDGWQEPGHHRLWISNGWSSVLGVQTLLIQLFQNF